MLQSGEIGPNARQTHYKHKNIEHLCVVNLPANAAIHEHILTRTFFASCLSILSQLRPFSTGGTEASWSTRKDTRPQPFPHLSRITPHFFAHACALNHSKPFSKRISTKCPVNIPDRFTPVRSLKHPGLYFLHLLFPCLPNSISSF